MIVVGPTTLIVHYIYLFCTLPFIDHLHRFHRHIFGLEMSCLDDCENGQHLCLFQDVDPGILVCLVDIVRFLLDRNYLKVRQPGHALPHV